MRSTLAHRAHRSSVHWIGSYRDRILSAGADGQLLAWDPERPAEVRVLATLPDAIYSAAVIASTSLIVLGTAKGELFVLDLDRKAELQRIAAHAGPIFRIAALQDTLLAIAGDGILTSWVHGRDGRLALSRRIPLSDAKLRALEASGDRLAVASGDGTVQILGTGLLDLITQWTAHGTGASALAWHPDKPVLLSGGKDGMLAAWDAEHDLRPVVRIAAHRSTIYAMAFSPDGRSLATASRDKTVKIWDARTLDPLERLDIKHGGHTHSVNALLWTPEALYSSGDDRQLLSWGP